MKILIFSDVCFNDNIFPMYKNMLDMGLDVTCLINLTSLKSMLFDIDKRLPRQTIIKASEYEELRVYEKYVDISRIYLVNHKIDKCHFWRDLTSTLSIMRFIKNGNYDVIHCDFIFTRSKMLLYKFKEKLVLIKHDPFPHSGHYYSKEYYKALIKAYKNIPKIVILNNYHLDKFCQEYNIDRSKVFVNKLGALDCITTFASENIKEKKNNILFFGRIVEYKGVEFLCEAMKKVHEVIPDATCTIAGSGRFYFDIEQYRKLPYFEIHNRYIKEDELAHYLQQCSISICAYTDATQSGGILTSFAMNKPVIASDLATMREMVEDGVNCILVKPKDVDSLADGIIKLLQNDDLRHRLSENIMRQNREGDYSWNGIINKYLEIYSN